MSQLALFALCLLLLVAIGAVDWLTGTQVRTFPLYFVPIMAVAWRLSRRYAVLAAGSSAVTWFVSNALAENIPIPLQLVNTVTMFVAFAVVGVLFAELRGRLDRERESSRTDALTELPNRRGFLERAEVLLAAGRRSARAMTLAYIDLDHFKQVNDEHGHATGDNALRTAAAVLRTSTREGDIVGRLGGDELAVLFPDTTRPQAAELLERLRAAMAARMTELGWPITSSIGAITFTADRLALADAIAAADRTMYEVKQGGRNRVHVEDADRC